MNGLISVIVPVYNVERYLKKCLDSIQNQTYEKMEILLINDGSTDSCREICEEYQSADPRFILINQQNKGLSSARNTGIDKANGDYLMFVDSDDFVDEHICEILLRNLQRAAADISVCSFCRVTEREACGSFLTNNIRTFSNIGCLYNIYNDLCDESTVAWGKLYKRNLFEKIRYPLNKIHEDDFTTYKLFYLAGQVVYTDAKLYFYVTRSDSIMNTGFSLIRLHRLDAYEERMAFFKEQHLEELYLLTVQRYLEKAEICSVLLKKYFPDQPCIRQSIVDRCHKLYVNNRLSFQIKLLDKIQHFLFDKNIFLYVCYKKLRLWASAGKKKIYGIWKPT